MGKVEYVSENVTIDNVPNLSALNEIEISLYMVNPNGFSLLNHSPSFSFTLDDGTTTGSAYTEEMVDPTYVRIRTTLDDGTEGKRITLSGCLWPENRTTFSEDKLRESYPELFYSVSFIQNTPPDNIKNLQRAKDFFPGTQKCYVAFEVPKQSLNRNKDSSYEVKYFFRNDDNSLELKGSRVLTLADNKNPTAGSDVFMYYFDGQLDDFLTRYEYTVQVIGPHGLTADIRSTDPALGACVLVESAITVLDTPNGLYDEDSDGDYECYEIESEADSITFTAVPGQDGDTLTVTDNGTVLTPTNGNTYTVSGLGRHEIKATSSRTDAFSVTVSKRLRIVVTPNPATFTFGTNDTDTYFNDMTDTNGFEYLEVPQSTSTVGYTISPTEEGTTLSGTVDGIAYNGPVNGVNIDVGPHTLVAVIHKQYCNDVTTTRKIMVAKTLEAPVYTFDPDLNGMTVGDFEYLEVPSSTAKTDYTIKPSTADGNAKVSGSVGSTAFTATAQKTGQLGTGDYTFTIIVSKDYMISRTFTKKVKVDSKLTPPEIAFTSPAPNGQRDDLYEYIEVDNSSSKASYTVTDKDSRDGTTVSTVVTAMPGDTQISTSDSGYLDTGIPGSPKKYKIVATVKKDGYVDQTTTKFVAVVAKLKAPKIEFGKDFNGTGKDSSGYLYIEVPDSTTTVSYTSSSDDNSGSNNPVTVSTKIGGWANPNTGTLNTNIGEYDITVTASCAFQNDATFTTKVKVVQELQEPNYLFTPDLTSESEDKWIEVPKTDHNVSCKITAKASDEKIKVTEGGTTLYNTGSSPANFTLNTLGDHTLSVTVSRANYKSRTFSKTVKIVEELQAPNEIISYDGSTVSPSGTINYNSYSYPVYKIDLNPDGTGELWYRFTPKEEDASIKVEDCVSGTPVEIDKEGTLPLGPHKLKFTITKDGYTPQYYTKDIYVKGTLTTPEIKSTNGTYKSGNGDSNTDPLVWQFSYLNYDSLECYIKPGNTGNTVEVHHNSETGTTLTNPTTGFGLGYDTTIKLVIIQSREHCESLTTTKYVKGIIKPIKLTFTKLYINIDGFDADSFNAKGVISIVGPGSTVAVWDHSDDQQAVSQNNWCEPAGNKNAWSDTFTSPSQTIRVDVTNFRRHRGGPKKDEPVFTSGTHNFPEISLYDIKKGKGENSTAGSTWTYICDQSNRSGQKFQPKITFSASDTN